MKTAKLKGTIYERLIVNEYVAADPENRSAGRFSGSANKGNVKLDVVGFDFFTKTVFVCQAKKSPRWTDSLKAREQQKLQELFKGTWTVDARFL